MTALKIVQVTETAAREQAARLFGACIAHHWPVPGPEVAYGWVVEEFQLPRTIVLAVYDDTGQYMLACMAATPLELMWLHLSPEERDLLVIDTCALPESGGLEIPGGMVHLGGIAVSKDHRGQGLVERMFDELARLIRKEMGRSFLVAQTARPNAKWPKLRGLHRCLALGFHEFENCATLSPTVGGLNKVWMWRVI